MDFGISRADLGVVCVVYTLVPLQGLMKILLTIAVLTMAVLPGPAQACSSFLVEANDGERFAVAKSYDWDMDQALVLTNRRGLKKQALTLDPRHQVHQWTARYGSLTFNQYGAELPNGGINEAGLVVEVLWLNASQYPSADQRPVLNELQWIQWALDTQSDVAGLAKAAQEVRVMPVYAKVHYFACDAQRQCATFEYLEGKLVVHRADGLPVAALTNHPYDESLQFYRRRTGKKKSGSLPSGTGSLARFVRAGSAPRSKDPVRAAFDTLDSVSMGDYSVWNIVYEPQGRAVYFRTRNQSAIKVVKLAQLDFACKGQSMMLDIQYGVGGAVDGAFAPATAAANRKLIDSSIGGIANQLPPGIIDSLAAYPSLLRCAH